MRESEFIIICNNNCVDTNIAIENEAVYSFLVEAKEKYKGVKTNAAMVALDVIIKNQF